MCYILTENVITLSVGERRYIDTSKFMANITSGENIWKEGGEEVKGMERPRHNSGD